MGIEMLIEKADNLAYYDYCRLLREFGGTYNYSIVILIGSPLLCVYP